ncbi:hypothetical protein Tco_0922507 [Tanacetum coccineum]|uniref:Uncharacterized protein n=1 Tax=Tanacetum coccineum TaxID=301880 RepID=A0ABQ5D0Q3_9ASTR
MQMMYCFINNIYFDYAELLWEGPHYSFHHLTSSIPYLIFTKIIISHYMTNFPEISRRTRDTYHNLKDDDIIKNIFNSGRYKDRVGVKILDWMILEEMKHTENYRMYAEVFGIDVPLTHSHPNESTHGTHRTPRAPMRSTRLTPPAPVPTIDKADDMILQDILQVSLAEHKSQEEQETRENVEMVNKHLASEEIEKMPRSDKESPEVEITNVVIPVNVNEEEEEITDQVYELKQREKWKIVEESRSTPSPTPIRSPRIHTDLVSLNTEKLQELMEVMVESLPTMVDKHIKEQVKKQVPEQVNIKEQVEKQVPDAKWQKTSEYKAHVTGESSGQVNENDDEIPTKQVSQDIMEELSLTINEAELKKIVDEMLRQRCTSGDEYQYHIDQMKNFLKSDIVWESRKEILKGNSRPEKIVLSLHKIPASIFSDVYIEERVHDFQLGIESNQQKVNLTAPTISFPGIEKHKMFSIIYEPVHGIIYKNSKKEKRVMRHSEIHKFCDATLNRVLEGLKSYNNDVKYGYIQRDLTEDKVEYLKLFEEEIEVRLKYHNQMRRWEMYVNGRPLGPRRERPE